MPGMKPRPEKRRIAQSFGFAARRYDGVAALQRETGHQLLAWVDARMGADSLVLDAGAGTGFFTAELALRCPAMHLMALDLSEGMLGVAGERFRGWRVRGDMEALPLSDACIDLIFSNMAIQWCDADVVFREFRRVLKPGGSVCFTSLGPATLGELRGAWASVDAGVHVNDFASQTTLLEVLESSGFSVAVFEARRRELEYPDAMALMRELKCLGAHNLMPGRARGLMGKSALGTLLRIYRERFPAGEGVRATFEVFQGVANAIDQ